MSQRWHGDSDKLVTGYRVEDFAAEVVHLLDALHIERAVLAGHSGSCLVARCGAVHRPDRVAGLVLEASPTTLHGHAGLEAFVASLAALEDPTDPRFARAVVVDTSSAGLRPEVIEWALHRQRAPGTSVGSALFEVTATAPDDAGRAPEAES